MNAVIAAIVIAIAFAGGWTVEGWRKDTEISELKRTHSKEIATQATDAAERLTVARDRGDRLVKDAAAQQTAIDQLKEEKDHAIRRLTVGRRCLDGAAVRVLNANATLKPGLPEAPSQPVSADAAFATDTDIGIWIGQCQRGYDTCRGRLQAISDFYEQEAARD